MTNDEIRELLRIFNESGVGELEVQRGPDRLLIRRGSSAPSPAPATAHAAQPAIPLVHAAALAEPVPAPAPAKPAEPTSSHFLQTSPIVGTYFDAPSPGAPPFVKVGDQVEAGQILCIIESMKLMNEIEAEVTGIVVAKLVENGSPVEYAQPLISIEPR